MGRSLNTETNQFITGEGKKYPRNLKFLAPTSGNVQDEAS
jgi:hypothetical protein